MEREEAKSTGQSAIDDVLSVLPRSARDITKTAHGWNPAVFFEIDSRLRPMAEEHAHLYSAAERASNTLSDGAPMRCEIPVIMQLSDGFLAVCSIKLFLRLST